jgi:hypothetical protein
MKCRTVKQSGQHDKKNGKGEGSEGWQKQVALWTIDMLELHCNRNCYGQKKTGSMTLQ